MVFLTRTRCQCRPPRTLWDRTSVWAHWRRWRANGIWSRPMARLSAVVLILHDREGLPSMAMVDVQTVRGARYGPTFHAAGA
jgi:hypothetical protein